MSGYVKKRGQDEGGVYRAKCKGLAARYGYDLDELWFVWSQLALCYEAEHVARMPREAHEQTAWRHLEAIYLKQGQEGD